MAATPHDVRALTEIFAQSALLVPEPVFLVAAPFERPWRPAYGQERPMPAIDQDWRTGRGLPRLPDARPTDAEGIAGLDALRARLLALRDATPACAGVDPRYFQTTAAHSLVLCAAQPELFVQAAGVYARYAPPGLIEALNAGTWRRARALLAHPRVRKRVCREWQGTPNAPAFVRATATALLEDGLTGAYGDALNARDAALGSWAEAAVTTVLCGVLASMSGFLNHYCATAPGPPP